MNKKDVVLKNFSLGGYRSFGEKIQRFEGLSKINLFVGQNNCGKSNVLRFLHEVYTRLASGSVVVFDQLDHHVLGRPRFVTGTSIFLPATAGGDWPYFDEQLAPKLGEYSTMVRNFLFRVFQEKAKLDKESKVWFDFTADGKLSDENWEHAFNTLPDHEIQQLWSLLTEKREGNRKQHWYPQSLSALIPTWKGIKTAMVPAIRRVGEKNSTSEEFGGEGLIERLVQLQNPDVHSRSDNEKFQKIIKFLRAVTDNSSASIEIPHKKDTILVIMDGKTLPLESLGTGLHEVIILAAAATILEETLVCMEEPELHLNPVLQKKFIRYLLESTNNQYFISTHSAAFMDTPGAQVYHIELKDGKSIVEHATTDKKRSAICEDLGYHPSDLLQSNCVIWVEGPSDRIYLNWWIASVSRKFVEGIHYSIMFYGGRLASHISGEDINIISQLVDDFISLRRLNRRGVILIDSDRQKKGATLHATKIRLRKEFDEGPGFAWVTEGREIENYLDPALIKHAIQETMPSSTVISNCGTFDNTLSVRRRNGKPSQASKVQVAKHIVEHDQPVLARLDLSKQIHKLIGFIDESNVGVHA